MNKNIIYKLLDSKGKANELEAGQVEKLITLFPYCEVTRIMDLLFKKNNNDLLFEKKLSEHIIHIHNREFLFFMVNDYSVKKEKRQKEPITNKKLKKQSFNDWLKKPIANSNLKKSVKNKAAKLKNYKTNNDDLMTETLAKLYIEQKHFDQAIRAYEILSLKYPKKSSFFVREIEKIKQLILITDE